VEPVSPLVSIGGSASPSGEEHARAAEVADRMRAIGLEEVGIDDAPNVTGRIRGRSGRAIVFGATLDDLATVAEHQRAAGQPPRVAGERVVGPDTNTSLVTVAMLEVAAALVASGFRPERDLVFARRSRTLYAPCSRTWRQRRRSSWPWSRTSSHRAGRSPARANPATCVYRGRSRHLGIEPVLSDAGSSNINMAVAGGTLAIGLGGERGGRRGFADEGADVPTLIRTARHVLLLAAVLGR
jgi:hypothetical protein